MADFGQDAVIAIASSDEFNSVLHTLGSFCTALIKFCSIIM